MEKVKRFGIKGIVAACVFLLAFVFSLQCSIHIWHVGIPLTDSSVFRYVANVILDGGMPYRDAFDHKGPLLYLLNAVGMLISEWRGVWLIELATLFATFALIYKTARLKCGRAGSLVVLLCSVVPLFAYFQQGNLVEEYALPFIAAAIYIFADYFLNDRINRRRLILCGLSFAAVCLLRINMAVVWVAMCAAVLVQCCLMRRYDHLGYFIAYFLLGCMLLAAPILLWLVAGGAFSAFIGDYISFNLMYSTAAEMSVSELFLLFLKEKFTLTAFAVSIFLAVKKRDIFHCFYAVFLILTLVSIAMSGRNNPHYAMIVIPVLAYPFASVMMMLERKIRAKKGAALLSGLLVLLVLVHQVLPAWFSAMEHGIQAYHTQEEAYIGSRSGKTRDIIRNYTREDDRIIVCGNWNEIYNLSGRFAASRYSYQSPVGKISAKILEEFKDDMENNMPKAIVLPRRSFMGDWMRDFIDRYGYQLVWGTDDGYADVYVLDAAEYEEEEGY